MLRYLLITLEYYPFNGGVANYYHNLFNYWPKSSELKILHTFKKLKIIQAIAKRDYDSIIVGQIFPIGTIIFFLSFIFKFNYTVMLHGMDFNFSLRKKRLSRLILCRAKKIICSNSFTFDEVLAFLGEENKNKIHVVNPGVSLDIINNVEENIRQKYGLENKKIILSVGRFVKRKGFDKILEILPELIKIDNNIFFVLIGSGQELDSYQEIINNLHIENFVLIKEAGDAEKNSWYQESLFFAMPSYRIGGDYEGFGIVYLEAGIFKKAVIAGKDGGVVDAVKNNFTGLSVDPFNKTELLNVFKKMIQDEDMRKKMGEHGYEMILENFLWEKQANKFEGLL